MQKEERDLPERTKAFALRIVRMFSALPKATVAQVVGKQVTSIAVIIGGYNEQD